MGDKTPSRQLRWDAKADSDLLMAVILNGRDISDFKGGLEWDGIHNQMVRWGWDFSKDAMSQHFGKKILRGYKNRVQGAAAATPTSATPKKRAWTAGSAANGTDNADQVQSTPTKKGRRTIKKEEEDDSDAKPDIGSARKRVKKEHSPESPIITPKVEE